MGCAAAEATLRVIQEEGLLENAADRGEQLMSGLAEIQRRFPILGDVRGLGLMVGCEFTVPETGEPAPAFTQKVVGHALMEDKLILLTCGMYGNAIRWIPPLIVTKAQIDEGLEKFERAVNAQF